VRKGWKNLRLIELHPKSAAAEEARQLARKTMPQREAGTGRPTKRERRELDELMADAAEEQADFEEFVKSFTKRS